MNYQHDVSCSCVLNAIFKYVSVVMQSGVCNFLQIEYKFPASAMYKKIRGKMENSDWRQIFMATWLGLELNLFVGLVAIAGFTQRIDCGILGY